jgi:hypothetical protein
MTPSQLKYYHEEYNSDSHYFKHKTMKFFGDIIKNYGVRTLSQCYELYRKQPVKHGLSHSAYFDKSTFKKISIEEVDKYLPTKETTKCN